MNDALLVGGIERVQDLSADGECLAERQRAMHQSIGKRRPFDQFENERPNASGFLDAIDDRDVGMGQRSKQFGLALKPHQPIDVGPGARQYLDSDFALQAAVARTVNLTHAARSDGREDFIGPKAIAGGQAHRRERLSAPILNGASVTSPALAVRLKPDATTSA